MNPTILNRDFQHPSDGWYQIEPRGEHPNRAAGIVQVIDDEAVNEIVNRFNQDANTGRLRHGREMLIDHEHFSDQQDQETRAYGWLQELQNREDGIYGRIRWTTTGKAAVDGGDYRFFSTEYEPTDVKVINSGKPRRVRPVRLDGLTLTNMPNNRGQRPITNREEFRRPARGPADNTETNQTPNAKMKTVCTLLGLSADASEEAVHAAVSKIVNRGDITAADLATLRDSEKNLKSSNETLLKEQIDGLLDAHHVTDEKIRNRMVGVLTPMKNREERIECLEEFGFSTEEEKEKPAPETTKQARVLNRANGKPATGKETATDDAAKAEKIRNRANELKGGTPTRDWDSCWSQAAREVSAGK